MIDHLVPAGRLINKVLGGATGAGLGNLLPKDRRQDNGRRITPGLSREGGQEIESRPIDAHHSAHIKDGLHPPFNLQGVGTGRHQLRQPLEQAEILGVEDIGAPLVLFHRKILAGPLLFRERIAVAAGMGAVTLIGVTPGHVIGEHAAAGIGDTEGSMDKDLQLALHLVPDLGDLRQ